MRFLNGYSSKAKKTLGQVKYQHHRINSLKSMESMEDETVALQMSNLTRQSYSTFQFSETPQHLNSKIMQRAFDISQ
jgi:hypothetical protein